MKNEQCDFQPRCGFTFILLFACELGLCYARNLYFEQELFWYQQGQDLPVHPRQQDRTGPTLRTGRALLLWAFFILWGSTPSQLSTRFQ